jgi:hypothetical protein
MEAFRRFYLRTWRGSALGLSLAVIAYLLYFSRLSSLPAGYSAGEVNTYTDASNWHNILNSPVNLPYKVLAWISIIVTHHNALATRIVAAIIGTITAILFFAVVRAWCTYRAAFLATVLFTTSAGLLHFARLGSGDILQMSTLALLGFALWYRKQREHRIIIAYLIIILFVLLWYVPGMIWFELIGLIPLRVTIRSQIRHIKLMHRIGLVVVFLACLAPLGRAAVKRPELLQRLIGLPEHLHTLTRFGDNLWHAAFGIVVHSNGNPLFWVGHAPLLDTVEVIFALLGGYYVYREVSGRRVFMFGSTLIGLILVSLGGSVTFACLVPVLYLFIATGIDRFLDSWLTVFPRNPVARIGGIGIVCLMLAFSVLYQVRTYYVAWPNAPATQRVFDHRI